MSISIKEENGHSIITIKEQPQLTEDTLGALIEFVDQVEDPNYLLNYLSNLEATALMYDPDSRDKWEKEFEMMQYLRNFLSVIRRYKYPNSSL